MGGTGGARQSTPAATAKPAANGSANNGSTNHGPTNGNGAHSGLRLPSTFRVRRAVGPGGFLGFPLLVDTYLLTQFFYYLFVLLGGFVLIFDAFTLFDLLGDIARNHVPVTTVLSYFGYLIPYMLLPSGAAGYVGGDARHAGGARKK